MFSLVLPVFCVVKEMMNGDGFLDSVIIAELIWGSLVLGLTRIRITVYISVDLGLLTGKHSVFCYQVWIFLVELLKIAVIYVAQCFISSGLLKADLNCNL